LKIQVGRQDAALRFALGEPGLLLVLANALPVISISLPPSIWRAGRRRRRFRKMNSR